MSNRRKTTDDKQAEKMIARLQKQEDDARADRRRRLYNGMSRALIHLSDAEMDALEPILAGAIGRSVMSR